MLPAVVQRGIGPDGVTQAALELNNALSLEHNMHEYKVYVLDSVARMPKEYRARYMVMSNTEFKTAMLHLAMQIRLCRVRLFTALLFGDLDFAEVEQLVMSIPENQHRAEEALNGSC